MLYLAYGVGAVLLFAVALFLALIAKEKKEAAEKLERERAEKARREAVEAHEQKCIDNNKAVYVGFSKDNPTAARSYDGENHLITVGPPGTGKSTSLLMPNLAYLDRSILVIDPKGELAAVTAQKRAQFGKVVILNPFGVLAEGRPYMESHGFNPLALLDPESNSFVDDVAAIAEGLVRIRGTDEHWSEGGQDFVAALIMHACRMDGAAADLGLVRKLLTMPRTADGLERIIREMLHCGFDPIEQKIGRFGEKTNEVSSIISAAISQTKFLDSRQIVRDLESGNVFDFASMRKETITVYLILPINQLSTHANWLRLIVAAALRALTKTPDDEQNRPPVLFMLDEFAQLGHMQSIADAMSAARGFRVQMWPMLQDLSQLKNVYKELWENFLGTAGFQSFFTPRTLTTAEHLSKRCGSHIQGCSVLRGEFG